MRQQLAPLKDQHELKRSEYKKKILGQARQTTVLSQANDYFKL